VPSRSTRTIEAQGTLAEENRLYEVALAARNAGDDRRAAEAFGQLLARYPRSVLGEQSLAERFRALDRAGQVSLSVAAARRYLAAYPEGFAKADAERIVKR
jgi:outer membrane protein assembly factor BamD (BamD/ComL family)